MRFVHKPASWPIIRVEIFHRPVIEWPNVTFDNWNIYSAPKLGESLNFRNNKKAGENPTEPNNETKERREDEK